jgi:hypothetical protein
MRAPKLRKRPTRVQRSILEQMAHGAMIVIGPAKSGMYRLTGGSDPDRIVNLRTAASMRVAGWIWAGPNLPSYVITMDGRHILTV